MGDGRRSREVEDVRRETGVNKSVAGPNQTKLTHCNAKEMLFLKSPFLPSVFFSTSSLLLICWSSSGRFSTTESPLMDRILAKVAAALQHRVAAAGEVKQLP